VSLSVYDVGFTLVNELRRVTLANGDNEVVFRQLPALVNPDTASLNPAGGGARIQLVGQRFEYDLGDARSLFERYVGQAVQVRAPGIAVRGTLLAYPGAPAVGRPEPLILAPEGRTDAQVFHADRLDEVTFPGAVKTAYLEPTLLCAVKAGQEGMQNVRLAYVTEGLAWKASYEILLNADGRSAQFSSRISMKNFSGGRFENARVKLVATAKGAVSPLDGSGGPALNPNAPSAQRYGYGDAEPAAERTVAGVAPEHTYELSQPMTIGQGETKYFQFALAPALPVSRFYVYDGVRFDRFQRNRRNDWNYGTEYHKAVETYLEMNNTKDAGLGIDLPAGHVRVYQQLADDSVDYLGEDEMAAVVPASAASVLLGPARGLQGERERTGYTEVRPLHEYEESFEIRLTNFSEETAEIRVVEHLYRWVDFEIVKSDAEYKATDAQTIEFRPTLKPGGKKSIKYTVRYRW
jgi:hypothetical protein